MGKAESQASVPKEKEVRAMGGEAHGSRNTRRVLLEPGAGLCVAPYPTSHLIWGPTLEVAGGSWGVFSSPVRWGGGCVWTGERVFCFSVPTASKGVDPRPPTLSSECVLSQKPSHTRSFCPSVPWFTQGVFNQAASKLVALPDVMV